MLLASPYIYINLTMVFKLTKSSLANLRLRPLFLHVTPQAYQLSAHPLQKPNFKKISEGSYCCPYIVSNV